MRNIDMERMLESLKGMLDRRDVIGYAAARNTRVLADELREYAAFKDGLIRELGEEEAGEDGGPTGVFFISPLSPSFTEFAERMGPIAQIEHDPDLFKLPYKEAIGTLSGKELLELEWMFED